MLSGAASAVARSAGADTQQVTSWKCGKNHNQQKVVEIQGQKMNMMKNFRPSLKQKFTKVSNQKLGMGGAPGRRRKSTQKGDFSAQFCYNVKMGLSLHFTSQMGVKTLVRLGIILFMLSGAASAVARSAGADTQQVTSWKFGKNHNQQKIYRCLHSYGFG